MKKGHSKREEDFGEVSGKTMTVHLTRHKWRKHRKSRRRKLLARKSLT